MKVRVRINKIKFRFNTGVNLTALNKTMKVVRSGPVLSSPVQSILVRSGPVLSGLVLSGPVRSGPVLSGPFRSCPVRSGPVRSCPVSIFLTLSATKGKWKHTIKTKALIRFQAKA
jgi:hypothetical protein